MLTSLPNTLTPLEVEKLLAERLKSLRLQVHYKRTTLAERAGVTVASLKRFETTGQISLKNLLRLAHALERLRWFNFTLTPFYLDLLFLTSNMIWRTDPDCQG